MSVSSEVDVASLTLGSGRRQNNQKHKVIQDSSENFHSNYTMFHHVPRGKKHSFSVSHRCKTDEFERLGQDGSL